MRPNNSSIHNDCSHSNENIIFDLTTVYHGAMSNRYIATNYSIIFLIGSMDDFAVLNVSVVAYNDRLDVPPHDCVKPYGAVLPHFYLPDHGGVFGQKTIFSEFRRKSSY